MSCILVVEDDPIQKTLITRLFKRGGASCDFFYAEDVQTAIQLLSCHQRFDVVTLDGNLRGNDHGSMVADYIVSKLWAKQDEVGVERTPFVTLSGTPYKAVGASASYSKSDFPSMILSKGTAAWIEEMKAARPVMPSRTAKTDAVLMAGAPVASIVAPRV